jgi:hypothetical protein
MSSTLKAAVFFSVLLTAPAAWAEGFTIGPSLATFNSGGGSVYGVDATVILGKDAPAGWLSGGLRGTGGSSGNRYMPYIEVGRWFLFNFGLGATFAASGGHDTAALGHAFIGLPIGMPLIYVEPYWRPTYGAVFDPAGWYHELGILIKGGVVKTKTNFRF